MVPCVSIQLTFLKLVHRGLPSYADMQQVDVYFREPLQQLRHGASQLRFGARDKSRRPQSPHRTQVYLCDIGVAHARL